MLHFSMQAIQLLSSSAGNSGLVPFEGFAIPQVATAVVSSIASSAMVFMISNTERGLKTPYRRMIFALCVWDIVQSMALLTAPFFLPSALSNFWGAGFTTGFLLTFGMFAIPMYRSFSFRVYKDPPATNKTVPSIDSTIYTYMGEDGERAPIGTTLLIIHPSVTIIKHDAFSLCSEIKKCFMHDGVHTIEKHAFFGCDAMKVIRLSRTLTRIEEDAFNGCSSLEAVFLPPSVNEIDKYAFSLCHNLRIFTLPLNLDISQVGERMLHCCNTFFQTTQIQEYDEILDVDDNNNDNDRVHQQIIHFYRDQVPPLHKASLDIHVTGQTIQECINAHGRATASITDHNGMTALHILAMNPHADTNVILACFDLNMSCAFVEDNRGNTPLEYLKVHHDGIEAHTSLVTSLCMHWDAASGAKSGT